MDRLIIFDAKEVHKVQEYSGERFMIALYQSPFRHDVDKKLTGRLKAAGFVAEEARAWSLPRRVALDPEQVQDGKVLYAGRGSDRLGLAPSIWGNPRKIGRGVSPGQAVELFAKDSGERSDLNEALPQLEGRRFGNSATSTSWRPPSRT